jgi:hypothetical protein
MKPNRCALIGMIVPLCTAVLALPIDKIPAPNTEFTDVAVSCSGDDSVGVRLCSAVKEKVRASGKFHLVEECQTKVLCISLITIDVDAGVEGVEEGNESTASVVITGRPFYLLEHLLYTVGGQRVGVQAEDIVATAENTQTDLKDSW